MVKYKGFDETKKTDSNANGLNDIVISIKKKDIKRSSNLVQDEHEHLICAFNSRHLPASATARWNNHLSGTKKEKISDIRKKLNKKIKEWEQSNSLSVEDFFLFIALELRLRASSKNDKHFSYYVSFYETNDRFTLRISDHHFDSRTERYDKSKHITALTFSDIESEGWDYFKPDKHVNATEYVYYENKLSKKDFFAIANDVITFIETGKYTPSVEPDETNVSPQKLQGITLFGNEDDLAVKLSEKYESGEKLDWRKAQALAQEMRLELSEQELMQSCELAVVLEARRIARLKSTMKDRYDRLVDLYSRQVTIQPKDSVSLRLQQYSTPCPIAYLLGEYVKKGQSSQALYFEPTAGNGLLTIGLPMENTMVNEIDEYRIKNLKLQDFKKVLAIDATNFEELKANILQGKSNLPTPINGIIMNPPFGKTKNPQSFETETIRNGETYRGSITFERLDFQIATGILKAFSKEKQNTFGTRAAIIIGGKLGQKYLDYKSVYWDRYGRLFGEYGKFINYINRDFNIEDILYLNGDLYRKQGTTFPIVVILINGRRALYENDVNFTWHNYNPELDAPIETFAEFYHRMSKWLTDKNTETDDRKRALALLHLAKAKIAIAKANMRKLKKVFRGSRFNSVHSEYLLSLIDNANI